jgi:hypothetical protein
MLTSSRAPLGRAGAVAAAPAARGVTDSDACGRRRGAPTAPPARAAAGPGPGPLRYGPGRLLCARSRMSGEKERARERLRARSKQDREGAPLRSFDNCAPGFAAH